nr:uncharacterized protein LOC123571271 [Macaca fascicularis]
MKKDILAHMEALTTKASDTDPATAAVPSEVAPPVQTPLEDAPPIISQGVNGQKSMGEKENDEMEEMSHSTLCPSTVPGSSGPNVALVHTVLERASSAANDGGNVRKKNSHKGRNRKESKVVYLSWPRTLQPRASSAAPVLSQTYVMGALPVADVNVNAGQESREQRRNNKEKTVLLQPWKTPAGTLLPAASPVQSSLEGASLAANGEIKRGQKSRHQGRHEKNKKIVANPWPLRVQAWASFTVPAQVQTIFAEAIPVANDGVSVGHKSKDEIDKMSTPTLCQSAQDGVPCSATALEGTFPAANSGGKVGKKRRHKRRNRKNKSVLAHPWPLTVQVWASPTVADPVQTFFQRESPAEGSRVNVGQKIWRIHLANSEEETKAVLPCYVRAQVGAPFSATAPLQTSFERAPFLGDIYSKLNKFTRVPKRGDEKQMQNSVGQTLKFYQGWRNSERYPENQNFWKCTVMKFARQVDCCYGELCTRERMEALTLVNAHTHISSSVMGMQRREKEMVECLDGDMGKFLRHRREKKGN